MTFRPNSRSTIWVNLEDFPGLGRALASSDVSAAIEVTNGQPIVVERAMYLDTPGQVFGAGHESCRGHRPCDRVVPGGRGHRALFRPVRSRRQRE